MFRYFIYYFKTRELQKNIEWEKVIGENPPIFVPPIHYGKVIKVYTGDTFMILTKIPFYNETMETASMYSFIIHLDSVASHSGKYSRDALYRKICGKVIELSGVSCDKYGKIYANIFFDNVCINEWLLNNNFVFPCKNERRRRVSESDSHAYDNRSSLPCILPSILRERTNTISIIQTDCFLSHNWGEKQMNHEKVKKINVILKQRGIKTWLDENEIDGNIRYNMAEGIDNTKCMVVFITREYRDKVNGMDMKDNCKYEFTYAMNQLGSQNMIPVIMEKEMRETNKWKGELGAALGNMLYVDFSEDKEKEIEKKYDELYKRIRNVIYRESKKVGI